jgi:hypothetical protein
MKMAIVLILQRQNKFLFLINRIIWMFIHSFKQEDLCHSVGNNHPLLNGVQKPVFKEIDYIIKNYAKNI